MSILCSGCGQPTTPRTVPKGPRGPWVANECLSGCVTPDGKYKLTTKGSGATAQPKAQAPVSNSIEKKLDTILAILKENFPPLKEAEVEEEITPF